MFTRSELMRFFTCACYRVTCTAIITGLKTVWKKTSRMQFYNFYQNFDVKYTNKLFSDEKGFCQPNETTSSNPCTGLNRPWGFQEVETPRFQNSRYMMVVRLSALHNGRIYSPGNIPGTRVVRVRVDPMAIIWPKGNEKFLWLPGIERATFRFVAQCLKTTPNTLFKYGE